MTDAPAEDGTEPKLTCQVCCNNPHKYTCPRCRYKTCSMSCCLEHKIKFGCSGVRDTTVLCTKHEFDAFTFQQDYRLLEDIDRRNTRRERQLLKLSRKRRAKQRGRQALLKAATEAGLNLRLSDSGILSRAKTNQTHLETKSGSPLEITWSFEFNLLPCTYFPKGTSLSRLKPLRFVLHNCSEQSRLSSLWTDRLITVNSDEQDTLITYRPAGSPPFGVVASWLYTRLRPAADANYFFYVQTERRVTGVTGKPTTRCFEPVEVFLTSRLYKILRTPDLIIHEMPTIWVSRGKLVAVD